MTRPHNELPDGWRTATLGSVGKWGSGGTPRRGVSGFYGGSIPWLKISDLTDGSVTESEETITQEGLKSSSAKLVDPGTLLIAMYGSIGKLGIPAMSCATNQAIAFCAPHPAITTSRFLFQLLLYLRPTLIGAGKGGNQLNISQTVLKALEVPLPPLDEQLRLVHCLESVASSSVSAASRLASARQVIERFRQAVLAAACSGRLTADWRERRKEVEPAAELLNRIQAERAVAAGGKSSFSEPPDVVTNGDFPATWEWTTCEAICRPDRSLTYGVIKLGDPITGGIPTLRSSDVRHLRIAEGNVKRISPAISANYGRTVLEGGEIVVTVRGSLGGVAVVPRRMAGYNVSREVAVVPLMSTVSAEFYAYVIGSLQSQNWLKSVSKGVAYTGINIQDLKRLPVPLPPLTEQLEITRRVDELLSLATRLEERIAAASKRVERSSQAVRAKGFRGELLPHA